jgi:predicted site-specific integrase-resolvase
MTKILPYPPPWQDKETLAAHLSVSANTVENWSAQGKLPAPRKIGGKVMWKWSEVDERLTLVGEGPDTLAEKIRNGTRAAASEIRN